MKENFDFYKTLASYLFEKSVSNVSILDRQSAKGSFFRLVYCGRDENSYALLELLKCKTELDVILKDVAYKHLRSLYTHDRFVRFYEDCDYIPPGPVGKALDDGIIDITSLTNLFKESLLCNPNRENKY